MAKQKMAMQKMQSGTPGWVKAISIWYYIGAAFLALLGLAMILGGSFLGTLLSTVPGAEAVSSALIGGVIIVVGVIVLGIAVLYFFIGKGLWKGKNWARIVAIVFAALGFLGSISSLISGNISSIVMLVIDGFIAWYLIFSKEAKAFFR